MEAMVQANYKPKKGFLLKTEQICTSRTFEGFRLHDLVTFLQSLMKMHHDPSVSFFAAMEERCQKVDLAQSHDHHQLSGIIQCMVKSGYNPTVATLKAFDCACEQNGFDGFSVQDLARIIVSLVKANYTPSSPFLDAFAEACVEHGFGAFSIRGLCSIVSTLGKLNGAITTRFWEVVEEWYTSNFFAGLDPKLLTMIVHAIGQVKRQANPLFLGSFMGKCQSIGLGRFDRRSLSIIICSLAVQSSGIGPSIEVFLQDFLVACETLGLDTFEARHLLVMTHSLIKLGHQPDSSRGWPSPSSLSSPSSVKRNADPSKPTPLGNKRPSKPTPLGNKRLKLD